MYSKKISNEIINLALDIEHFDNPDMNILKESDRKEFKFRLQYKYGISIDEETGYVMEADLNKMQSQVKSITPKINHEINSIKKTEGMLAKANNKMKSVKKKLDSQTNTVDWFSALPKRYLNSFEGIERSMRKGNDLSTPVYTAAVNRMNQPPQERYREFSPNHAKVISKLDKFAVKHHNIEVKILKFMKGLRERKKNVSIKKAKELDSTMRNMFEKLYSVNRKFVPTLRKARHLMSEDRIRGISTHPVYEMTNKYLNKIKSLKSRIGIGK